MARSGGRSIDAPPPAQTTLADYAELTAVLQEEDTKHRLENGLLVDVKVGGPAVFRTFYQEQVRKWGQVIRENGLKNSS